jgi:hypothetical protein
MSALTRVHTPEERELARKQADIDRLSAQLADRELELETLRAELTAFQIRYLRAVGPYYHEIDDLEARLAERHARQAPHDPAARRQAEEARARAEESREQIDAAAREPEPFIPTAELKALYRKAAARIHPDRSDNDADRHYRNEAMAALNAAYRAGDFARVQTLLHDYEQRPEAITGEDVGAKLIRLIRQVAQLEQHLAATEYEIAALRASELQQLQQRIEAEEAQGRDPLGQLAAQLQRQIETVRQILAQLAGTETNPA